MANLTELNTGKLIDAYLCHGDTIHECKCIKPTSTLTKDQCYRVILIKNAYHPSINHRDGIYIDKCAVINDRGLYVEVSANRFNIS